MISRRVLLMSTVLVVAAAGSVAAGTARIDENEAATLALNELSETAGGARLVNRRFAAEMSAQRLLFEPVAGPKWSWRLSCMSVGPDVVSLSAAAAPRIAASPRRVEIDRGALLEQYLVRRKSIEQRFILPGPEKLARRRGRWCRQGVGRRAGPRAGPTGRRTRRRTAW